MAAHTGRTQSESPATQRRAGASVGDKARLARWRAIAPRTLHKWVQLACLDTGAIIIRNPAA